MLMIAYVLSADLSLRQPHSTKFLFLNKDFSDSSRDRGVPASSVNVNRVLTLTIEGYNLLVSEVLSRREKISPNVLIATVNGQTISSNLKPSLFAGFAEKQNVTYSLPRYDCFQ